MNRNIIRKYKYYIVSFLCFALILLLSCRAFIIPPANNSDYISDIIKHDYLEDEILRLTKNGECIYSTLYQLDKDYKIECVRNPSSYNQVYLPYIVLSSDSGEKAFVFFDEDYIIRKCLITSEFYSHDKMYDLIMQANESRKSFSEFWIPLLKQYATGSSAGAYKSAYTIAVQEGVFVVTLTHHEYPELLSVDYYSDDVLFQKKSVSFEDKIFEIWPILSIDKQGGQTGEGQA